MWAGMQPPKPGAPGAAGRAGWRVASAAEQALAAPGALGDGSLSDMRAKLAREEAVEEAQRGKSGSSLVREWLVSCRAQDLVGASFQRAREAEGGREGGRRTRRALLFILRA